jgi:hypothetical protein
LVAMPGIEPGERTDLSSPFLRFWTRQHGPRRRSMTGRGTPAGRLNPNL